MSSKSLVLLLSIITFSFGQSFASNSSQSADPDRERFIERMSSIGIDINTPLSSDTWNALILSDQEFLIEFSKHKEGYWTGMKFIDFGAHGVSLPSQIHFKPYGEFLKKIDTDMRQVVYMDVMETDQAHSVIGDPVISSLTYLVRTSDRKVFGVEIRYYQEGCDMPDFESDVRWFESIESAEAAGCELSDVNWQASGLYGPDGERLSFSNSYMEWSGY